MNCIFSQPSNPSPILAGRGNTQTNTSQWVCTPPASATRDYPAGSSRFVDQLLEHAEDLEAIDVPVYHQEILFK